MHICFQSSYNHAIPHIVQSKIWKSKVWRQNYGRKDKVMINMTVLWFLPMSNFMSISATICPLLSICAITCEPYGNDLWNSEAYLISWNVVKKKTAFTALVFELPAIQTNQCLGYNSWTIKNLNSKVRWHVDFDDVLQVRKTTLSFSVSGFLSLAKYQWDLTPKPYGSIYVTL